MELMTTTEAFRPQLWTIEVSLLGTVLGAFSHWRFRTGWQMTSGRLRPRPAMRELLVLLGYPALPSTIGMFSCGLAMTIGRIWWGSHNVLYVGSVLMLAVVSFGAGCWAIKEFNRPTKRRTPDWLKQE